MTRKRDEQLTKRVEFAEKDEDEQIGRGIVMVPNAVDLQRDFVQPETIETFADQFENFIEAGEASGGVMHAVFPDDHTSLERNEVLDEETEIGGETVEAGAWVQEWKFEDDDLWTLVRDDILEGYSIGAVDVQWGGPYDQDELDDEIRVPDEIDEDEYIWELASALIREVSAVDTPAVPEAMILETKADAEKRLSDHLGNRDGFIEEALERGHSEGEAERLWEYLNRAVDVEGAGEPGKQSFFERIGKAAVNAFTGADSDSSGGATAAETPDTDPRKDRDRETAKEGRTLSTANQHSLFATIDAAADVLQDAGVDHGIQRFTDREDTDFDLSEHSARTWPDPDDDDEEDSDTTDTFPDSMTESAAGGETPGSTTMTDDNPDDPMADAPEWAKALDDRIDDLENEKAGGEEPDEPLEDAPEWAKDIASRVDEIEEKALGDDTEEDKPEWAKNLEKRIDTISKQTGTDSQQLGKGAETEEEKNGGFTLDPRKARGN